MLKLADTAGIHDTEDVVENIGVDRAKKYVDNADFVIYVVDSSMELDEDDEQIIDILFGKRGVVLLNKSDLDTKVSDMDIREKINWDCIEFSNQTRQGLKVLEEYIQSSFLKGEISYNDQIYLTNIRHKEAVEEAINSLKKVKETLDAMMPEDFLTIDMLDAYKKLGLINGETASEDLVNKIFKDFCMGK